MGDDLKPGLKKILIKLSLPGLVKHDESDTSQRSFQVFGLGQCYIPGITHFTSVDTFIQQTLISGVNYSRFTHAGILCRHSPDLDFKI